MGSAAEIEERFREALDHLTDLAHFMQVSLYMCMCICICVCAYCVYIDRVEV